MQEHAKRTIDQGNAPLVCDSQQSATAEENKDQLWECSVAHQPIQIVLHQVHLTVH